MGKLYLVRHAQSENNAIWDGRGDHQPGRVPDPEITELGHRQAKAVARHLAHPESEPRQHPYAETAETQYGFTHS